MVVISSTIKVRSDHLRRKGDEDAFRHKDEGVIILYYRCDEVVLRLEDD